MPFRSRARFARAPRKRPIWVNIPFGAVAFTESAGMQVLLVPEDWEAQFTGLSNEKATLQAIVGEVIIAQTAAGTLGGSLFWGIFKSGLALATPPVFTVASMGEVDWLHVGARATASSVSSSITTTTRMGTEEVRLKSKRKLTSQDSIYIVAQYGADAASPGGVLSGVLRFLITRD